MSSEPLRPFNLTSGKLHQSGYILGEEFGKEVYECKAVLPTEIYDKIHMTGVSLVSSSKESTCQYRKQEFHPWVGKITWRRKWQPTPVLLPRKFHQQRSLWDIMGLQRVGHDLETKQQQIHMIKILHYLCIEPNKVFFYLID